jgi:hypothetical protein
MKKVRLSLRRKKKDAPLAPPTVSADDIRQNWLTILSIPPDHITTDMYIEAVQQFPPYARQIPRTAQTPELVWAIVYADELLVECVRTDLLTDAVCDFVVQRDPHTLQLLPEAYHTLDRYRLAVEKDLHWFPRVPPETQTTDLCWKVLLHRPDYFMFIRDDLITRSMCLHALCVYPDLFRYVPPTFHTQDIVEWVVQHDGGFLRYVNPENINKSIARTAVQKTPAALQFVPDHLQTYDLCIQAVNENGTFLDYVTPRYRTRDLCRAALASDPSALRFVPPSLLTPSLCLIALENDLEVIRYLPEHVLVDLFQSGKLHEDAIMYLLDNQLLSDTLLNLLC